MARFAATILCSGENLLALITLFLGPYSATCAGKALPALALSFRALELFAHVN